MRHSCTSAALAAALAAAAAPHAADAQRRPHSPRRDTVVTLPNVSVTATREAAPILTTPLAVTKLTSADLRGVSGYGLDEALSRVPGVIAQSRYGTSDIRLMIRGFGARGAGDRSNSGTTRGVRVLLDGFPETEPDGRTSLDQLDLAAAEAVEVVRSNASALWGNAAGGVVNVVTRPAPGARALEVQPIYGGYGLTRHAARAAAPLGTSGSAWANFTNTSFDGWRAHSSARRQLVNAGAEGLVGERSRLGLYLTAANNLFHIPGPLTQAQLDADPGQANATYLARDERRYNRTGRLGVTFDHAFGGGSPLAALSEPSISATAFVNPKYLQRSERNTYRDFTRYHVGGSVVARGTVTTGNVTSRLSVGADDQYQDGAILFYTLSATQGRGTTLSDNKGEGANAFGAFVQDEIQATDRLAITLGARWDRVLYHYRSFLPAPPVRSDSRDFSRLSPKLGLSWLVDPSHSLYANVGGGIEVPAGNETDPTPGAPPSLLNPLLDPIRSTSYEVGFKAIAATLGARPLALGYDVALYDIEVTNEIVPYNGGRYYLTAGRARRQGAELGLHADARGGLFANAAVTLSHNRYLEYAVDSAVIFPTDATKRGRIATYDDNKVVGVPDVLANVEAGVAIPGARGLRVKAGVEHSGDYYADDANAVRVPSYTILNLGAELREPIVSAGGYGLRGFVTLRNATNRRYVGSAFLNPDLVGTAPAAFEPGMPRAVVVSLSLGRLR